jgi:hypothetical protein
MDYITSVFRLTDAGNSEITVKTALDFVEEQQQKFPKNRGPFLAQIEVQARLLARSGNSDESGGIEQKVFSFNNSLFLKKVPESLTFF